MERDDAVIDCNKPLSEAAIFNGSREEVTRWLRENKPEHGYWNIRVYMGDRNIYVDPWEYLNMYT